MSLLALAIAVLGTLTLFFGNFTLAYLLQALRGERIRAAGLFGSLLLTLLPLAALLWGGRLWWRVRRARAAQASPPPPGARPRRPRPPIGPAPAGGHRPGAGSPEPASLDIEAAERARLLSLARRRGGFDIRQALAESLLRPNELTYLLDAMISEGALEVEATEAGLRYRPGPEAGRTGDAPPR